MSKVVAAALIGGGVALAEVAAQRLRRRLGIPLWTADEAYVVKLGRWWRQH